MIKWVSAFFGYYYFRFPGAIFGFFVGSFLEKLVNGSRVNFQTSSKIIYNLKEERRLRTKLLLNIRDTILKL